MKNAWSAVIVRFIARLWYASLRYERHGPHPCGPGVIAFWHGHQLPLLGQRPDGELVAPMSLSRDGRFQKMIMAGFGIQGIDGSSSRGGFSAVRGLLRGLGGGAIALVAADGPRGPRYQAKAGAAFLASRCDVPLWTVGVAVVKPWVIRGAWDHFILPKPFSRAVVVFDGPFQLVDEEKTDMADLLTQRLVKINERAQALLHTPRTGSAERTLS